MGFIRLFITYIKENLQTDEKYAGHASGMVDESSTKEEASQQILKKRDSSHHKNKEGYEDGTVDKINTEKDAIIGREQMLIEKLKEDESCGNSRNAISPRKKDKMKRCIEAAIKLFGAVCLVLFFVYLYYKTY